MIRILRVGDPHITVANLKEGEKLKRRRAGSGGALSFSHDSSVCRWQWQDSAAFNEYDSAYARLSARNYS